MIYNRRTHLKQCSVFDICLLQLIPHCKKI